MVTLKLLSRTSTPHCTFLFLKKENKLSSGLCYRQLRKKKALYLIWASMYSARKYWLGTIFDFYVSYWRRDRHFTWSSEPREGLTACSTKEVPSQFTVILRPWVSVRPRVSNPRPSAQQSSALPTELTLLWSRFWCFRLFPFQDFFMPASSAWDDTRILAN